MSFSIFPRTVYKTKSKISGQIVVKEQLGRHTLYVQEMLQSGGIMKGMWKKAISNIKHPTSNILILGLGGGTAVGLIKSRWPEAKIVGLEIDPEIVKISRKFFDLDKIGNLKIMTADAIEWIRSYRGEKFDLILVDLYLGDKFPPKAASEGFLKNIKKLLKKEGTVALNRLKTDKTEDFREKLEDCFSQVESVKTSANTLFLIRS